MTTNNNRRPLLRGAAILAAMMMMAVLTVFSSTSALSCPVRVVIVDDAGILSSSNPITVGARTPIYEFADAFTGAGTYSIPWIDTLALNAASFSFINLYRPYPLNWPVVFNFPSYPGYTEQSFDFEDHNTPKHKYRAIVQLTWDSNHCPFIHILIINLI